MRTMTLPPLRDRVLTVTERDAVLARVDELLELTYRSRDLGNFDDPLEEVVYILLSRQTREEVYQRVHAELRAHWPDWPALLAAPLGEVTAVVGPAGFGPTRAGQLKELLAAVAEACRERGRPGEITLAWLGDLDDNEVEAFLLSLPGVGPKSARCVMHYALHRTAFAVDTHARRILDRLGLVTDPGGKVDHSRYEALVPDRMRKRLHVNLIHHGRAVCRTSQPRCGNCSLVSFCGRGRQKARTEDERPVAIEVFAGGGGMGAGFAKAGYRIALAVEADRDAAQTYRLNHPGTVVLEADARRVTVAAIRRLVPSATEPEVIVAGPPCQGYSAAGSREPGDMKNLLYCEVVRLARGLRPRFVAIENVPGMRRVGGVSFVKVVLADLAAAGYAAEDHMLRACDYGVPQLRHRLVYLAQRKRFRVAPPPPPPTHCPGRACRAGCGGRPGSRCGLPPTATVMDVLRDLPELDAGEEAEFREIGDMVLINGSTMRHSGEVIDKIKSIEAGKGPISYRRLHPDLARTIVAGHRALPVHPTRHRTISVREAARMQGFEDDHTFCGPRQNQPLQVANAVPPPMAEAIAMALRRAASDCHLA
jgi:DNA (cytosine-5)-methyltransferase 1